MRLLLVHFVKELCASPSNENRTWRCTPFGRVTQVSFTVVSLVTVLLPICAEKEKAQFYGNPLAVVGEYFIEYEKLERNEMHTSLSD